MCLSGGCKYGENVHDVAKNDNPETRMRIDEKRGGITKEKETSGAVLNCKGSKVNAREGCR